MKKLLCWAPLMVTLSLQAQPKTPAEVPGKISGLPANNAFKGISEKAFNTTLSKILEGMMTVRALAEPVGFDVKIFADISKFQPQLGEKRQTGKLTLFFYNYYIGNNGFLAKVEEAPASITVFLNQKDFSTSTAGYFKDYDERFGIPHPFQRVPVSASTSDYVEYNYKNYPFNEGYYRDFAFRVLCRNDRPVFIPFSRKDYGQYQIRLKQKTISDNEDKISGFKKELIQSQKNLKEPVFKHARQVIKDGIKSTEDIIINLQAENERHRETIDRYKNLLAKMPDDESHAVAYVDMESDRYAHGDFPYLVSYGRKEGRPLYVVNPDYYDNSRRPSETQSVIISYWYGKSCPAYLKERVKQIFDHIDYHQIKESMP